MRKNELQELFSKITADDMLKTKIIKKIDDRQSRQAPSYRTRRVIASATVIAAVVGATTVFAASPAGQKMIAYFQNEKAVELTSIEQLSKYNEAIGTSASYGGYTLTLDNLAADDNFLHVFYTVTGDHISGQLPWFDYRINGQRMKGNHNEEEGYYADENTYKGVTKLNVAQMNMPDSFRFEMYSPIDDSIFKDGYLYQEQLNLTENDISKLLYVSASANKTSIASESIIKNVNAKFTYQNGNSEQYEGEITKVIFSPFGAQLVIRDTHCGDAGLRVSGWALFDENGNSLDILNTGLQGTGKEGVECVNNLEFLKGSADMTLLTLVPTKSNEGGTATRVTQPIGTYPIRFETSNYGSIVITDIRCSDGMIEVDYYKDGFSLYDPFFELLDDNGNNVEPGGKLGCTLYTRVHHDTNSYTAQYIYEALDKNGNRLPMPESVSKENLEKQLTKLAVVKRNDLSLDYENAVSINLK